MIYLLDTNVCVKYLNGRSQNIKKSLEKLPPDNIVLCAVVKAELYAGACKSVNKEKTLEKLVFFYRPFKSLPFDDAAAEIYGKIRADLEKRGTPIGPYDLQIASIALANDLILVTHNIKEFERISELKIEDWE